MINYSWKKSVELWEMSEKADDTFSIVHRNLALAYYNKMGDSKAAKCELEKAFSLNRKDARIFLELDQLYKKLGYSFKERLANMMKIHLLQRAVMICILNILLL